LIKFPTGTKGNNTPEEGEARWSVPLQNTLEDKPYDSSKIPVRSKVLRNFRILERILI
jgi:hypothetical protein